MQSVKSVRAVAGQGFEGDRYFAKQGTFSATVGPSGEATLIESESVRALNAKLGTTISPGEMRRNIVTQGVALNHLVGQDFRVGDALLRGLRLCEPCAHLEKLTREGVIAETMHRCGLRAQILTGGTIRPGDSVTLLNDRLEENKNLIRRFFDEMWNPWNFAKADELLARDIVFSRHPRHRNQRPRRFSRLHAQGAIRVPRFSQHYRRNRRRK
jgi:MOSC domain-containing protein YiiM